MLLVPVPKSYEFPSEGTHRATVIDVVDAGTAKSNFSEDGRRDMLTVTFRIEDETGKDGKPILFPIDITKVVRPRSTFGKMLDALGSYPKNHAPFDAESIIGKSLYIKVRYVKQGKFADVVGFPKTTTRRQFATVVEEIMPQAGGEHVQTN